jgi:L-galactose dehydrogenase
LNDRERQVMKYRVLGKTGLNVSILSFGGSSLGGVFRDVSEAEGIRTVHSAIDMGINLIDVSPYYGLTRAESVLGKALCGIPRDRYFIATKVGRYGASSFDFSADRVRSSVDESLRRLRLDYVDIIQCHDIEFGSLDQVVGETLPALRELQTQGKARFVGITGLPLRIFRWVTARTEVDTILSYCRFSLNDTGLETLLPALQEKNIGVINASPLSMGLLTERGAPSWHPAPGEIKTACSLAATYCRNRGVPVEKLAIQFAVSHPGIHTTLVGTASPENLRKNVDWIESPTDEALLVEVRSILKPVLNKTWASGRPENN